MCELQSRARKLPRQPRFLGESHRISPKGTAMNEELFTCSKCHRQKPRSEFHKRWNEKQNCWFVTSQCASCRSDAYLAKRYKTVCPQCLKHKPLDKNKICRHCNEENGLKQCSACGHLLPIFLEFYSRQRRCKRCLKAASGQQEKVSAPKAARQRSEASASG